MPAVDRPVRTLAVWVPDWPLVAARAPSAEPVAVLSANRVVAATVAALAAGVRRGMRRREAQRRCPALAVLGHEPDRDARCFEPVIRALESLTPRIEVARSGWAAFPTRGPSRYFGGDEALAERAVTLVVDALADEGVPGPRDRGVSVGVADGPFAAAHAARWARATRVVGRAPVWVVPVGETATHLAPMPLEALERPELTDVLRRLGLCTLGDLAELPAADVAGRFGNEGLEAHRLARGLDLRPPATRPVPPDLVISAELDPPAERVDPAAFVARRLADELHRRLEARGSVCTRIVIVAETAHGERSERVWRDEGSLGPRAIVDRVRWQLDGWLHARARPTAGISRLVLQPEEIAPASGQQLELWGADRAGVDRAARAVARLEGLLGPGAAFVAEVVGGRDPQERVRLVPATAGDLGPGRRSEGTGRTRAPWPGALPAPSPATWHTDAIPVRVLDAAGHPVTVDGRCRPSAPPARVHAGPDGDPGVPVVAWAGPWPVDERWWDPIRASRRARFQVLGVDGTAHLVVLEGGRWAIAATYD